MKNILGGIALSAMLAAPAMAADIPARMPVKAPTPAAVVASNWSGCYIGGNGGYGRGTERRSSSTAAFWFGALPNSDDVEPRGGFGGGQVGCNLQGGSWVVGIEAMYDGASLKRTQTSLFFPASDVWSSKISAFWMVTGRIGYAAGSVMPYVKGGIAGVRQTSRFQDNITGGGQFIEERGWDTGAVVGGGLEFMLSGNWTVAVEYDHIWLGTESFTSTRRFLATGAATGVTDTWARRTHVDLIMGKLNYKFNWGGPVVARY